MRNKTAMVARNLRFPRNPRGWKRIVQAALRRDGDSTFRVRNAHGVHSGDLSDFIQRPLYLFGGYEREEIDAFLIRIPESRRGVALDIGANVGTSKVFESVLTFEPNPALWPVYERMQAENGCDSIILNRSALGAEEATLPFFLVDDYNSGMGTLVQKDQYQRPLKKAAEVRVRVGATLLKELGVPRVDVVKMDVQGFELEVVRGLRETIERDRPVIWIELAEGLHQSPDDRARLN